MKWYGLFKRIGKLELSKTKKFDVVAVIDDKEIPLDIKFRVDGSPYLVRKTN